MFRHQLRSIKESMAKGLTEDEAWLRELALVVQMEDKGIIDFTAIKLINPEGEVFYLDPINIEGNVNDGVYELTVHFEHLISELSNTFDFLDEPVKVDFDVKAFLQSITSLEYMLEDTDEQNHQHVKMIQSAKLLHPETELNITVDIWAENQHLLSALRQADAIEVDDDFVRHFEIHRYNKATYDHGDVVLDAGEGKQFSYIDLLRAVPSKSNPHQFSVTQQESGEECTLRVFTVEPLEIHYL